MVAQITFIQPPIFAGKKEEHVSEWIDRNEKIKNYNRWGDAKKDNHVELSLTGRLKNSSVTNKKRDTSQRIEER
jgi:hypothetical protein